MPGNQTLEVQALLAQGFEDHRQGRLSEAERVYQRVLQLAPGHPDALHLLGLAAHGRGDAAEAARRIRLAIERRPDETEFHANLALVLQDSGRHDEAIPSARRALALDPRHGAASKCLAASLAATGDLAAAARQYAEAGAISPDDAGLHAEHARVLEGLGRPDQARAEYERALQLHPGLAEARAGLARLDSAGGAAGDVQASAAVASVLDRAEARLRAMDFDGAVELARDAVVRAPESTRARRLLASALFPKGETREAADLLARVLEDVPDDLRTRLDLAVCLQGLGRLDDATRHFEVAVEMSPGSLEALSRLGNAYANGGRLDDARRTFESLLAIEPAMAGAHYELATLKRFEAGDPQIEQMREVMASGRLDVRQQATLCFALGRALDQVGELDEAMACFHRGNRLKRDLTDFSLEDERARVDAIREAYTDDAPAGATGDPSELPVFIVGMPRSGSTLVEQILAAHPGVHGAGELNELAWVLKDLAPWLPADDRLPEAAPRLPAEAWGELGRRYLGHLRRYDDDALRIVDKMPFNYLHVGAIRRMLPRARIIHTVRDPRDTCVSCYLTSFRHARGFSFDMADLAGTWRLYDELMSHWRDVCPDAFLDVRYEDLVDDTESGARRLIDYLGLEWDDACLRFSESTRTVTTASRAQVRSPVYRTSIGRWRRYADHLAPLIDALPPGETPARDNPRC